MKVKRNKLLLIAGIVWTFAGINILKIGLDVYKNNFNIVNIILSTIIFILFQKFVFYKLVTKHTDRIKKMKDEREFFLKFFDIKSYLIMFMMITFGIVLRAGSIVSELFIAVFYTGLGSALLLAGIMFGHNYLKEMMLERYGEGFKFHRKMCKH